MDRFVDYVKCLRLLVFNILLDSIPQGLPFPGHSPQERTALRMTLTPKWTRFFGVPEQFCNDLQRATEDQEDTLWNSPPPTPCSAHVAAPLPDGWLQSEEAYRRLRPVGSHTLNDWAVLDHSWTWDCLRGVDSRGERLPDTSFVPVLDWTRQRKTEPSLSRSQPGVKTHTHTHPHTLHTWTLTYTAILMPCSMCAHTHTHTHTQRSG